MGAVEGLGLGGGGDGEDLAEDSRSRGGRRGFVAVQDLGVEVGVVWPGDRPMADPDTGEEGRLGAVTSEGGAGHGRAEVEVAHQAVAEEQAHTHMAEDVQTPDHHGLVGGGLRHHSESYAAYGYGTEPGGRLWLARFHAVPSSRRRCATQGRRSWV